MHSSASCLAAVVALLWSGCAMAAAPASDLQVVSQGPALQARAEQLVVRSAKAGREYRIEITAPYTEPWLPGQKAPVVYALDGGYGIVGPVVWLLGGTSAMQPAYIVTIGYPAGQPFTRERDMLHAPAVREDGSRAEGGGAEAFTAFLTEELKPFIEARHPVDPDGAVLFGHSLSGIFTANVLARQPDSFAGYLIASPSVWADPQIAQRLAQVRPSDASPKVFVAYGELEEQHMVDGGRQVAEAAETNPAFTTRSQVFAGAEHVSYYPELISAGLSYLIPRKARVHFPLPVRLKADELAAYEGAYVFSDGRTIRIAREGDQLVTSGSQIPSETFSAAGPGEFFVNGVDAKLSFEREGDQRPKAVIVYLNGDRARAIRRAE